MSCQRILTVLLLSGSYLGTITSLKLATDHKQSKRHGGIAKIIHQTWKTAQLPQAFKKWSDSWKDCLPGWEHKLHTDEDNRNFIAKHFPEFLRTYDAYKRPIERVDAVRYAYLAVEGGLYVDLDIECLRDPSPVLDTMGNASVLLVREREGQVAQAFMGASSPPNGGFFEKIVHNELYPNRNKQILEATGPLMFSKAVFNLEGLDVSRWGTSFDTKTVQGKSGESYMLADTSLFLGIEFNDQKNKQLCLDREQCLRSFPNTYSFSHWSASWKKNTPLPSVAFAGVNRQALDQAAQCDCLMHTLSDTPHNRECPSDLLPPQTEDARLSMRELFSDYLSMCV